MSVTHKRETMSGPLTDREVSEYERTGWLLSRGFFTPSETADIARWTEELLARPEVPGKHMVYYEPSLLDGSRRIVQRIENFCPFHAPFDSLIRDGSLSRAVEQLLREPACLFKEKINLKLVGGGGFEAHQDQQAGWTRYAPIFVTALVCIDRATAENGCLQVADTPRLTGLIGEEWRPLNADEMKAFRIIDIPTEPGDVLFFDSYVPHASEPNLTEQTRRILYLTYNRLSDGDHRDLYFAEKRANFPPDIERVPGVEYKFRV